MNLKGFGIGDGYTDPYTQISAHADMVYNIGLADEKQRDHIQELADRVLKIERTKHSKLLIIF